MIVWRLLGIARDTRAAASAEFILIVPMVLPLIFGAMEAGNYFWSQQKLTQAVRDGARYAGRLNYNTICPSGNATTAVETNAETDIKNLTRTGDIDGGAPVLPKLTNARIAVVPNCGDFTSTGIYAGYGGAGAIVSIEAKSVPYRSILGRLGVIDDTFKLGASAHAPVIGI